jgi:hypothetical protein
MPHMPANNAPLTLRQCHENNWMSTLCVTTNWVLTRSKVFGLLPPTRQGSNWRWIQTLCLHNSVLQLCLQVTNSVAS